ncbi:glycosyltransferase [Pseudoduganella sp. LjRoot289]|uniref:glycosyltransferase n=1 Tax=Pseudoduganella sp. LjRoot289 TaxID=3342314 RepID=UPI003ECE3598
MRIVIDLQACQHGSRGNCAATIALVKALAASAGPHELWLALHAQAPGQEKLRHALGGSVPPERIRSYSLPAVDDASPRKGWQTAAAALIRTNFLQALGAELVYAPGTEADDDATPPAIGGALPADALQAPEAAARALWRRFEAALPATLEADLNTDLKAAASTAPAAGAARPRLAYLSPLPPEKSGIADYSVSVVNELAQWYEIDIVAEQTAIEPGLLQGEFPLRDVAWFERHAHEFDRIVYHFGNNHMHRYMFELLQRHPGVVVLHDFFLSGVVDQIERGGYRAGAFYQALYQSHGYGALLQQEQSNRNDTIWAFPASKAVLDHAAGVIVHSPYAGALAERWYGPGAADGWRVLPLPRVPAGDTATEYSRAAARARLDLADEDFIVCTFGMMGATKLNDELIDAFLASPLARDPRCRLVFVGENNTFEYGKAVDAKIAASGLAERITITGFVTPELYASYAAAADIAVQLRNMTRGETSAAILDCLLYGAPTVINAHGAAVDLPDEVLLKLPDQFTVAELGEALARLYGDAGLRASLGRAAAAHTRAHHTPRHAGPLYRAAIEHFAQHHPRNHYRKLPGALGAIATDVLPGKDDLLQAAHAIAFNQPPSSPRQLFVDISALVDSDLRTGIQRVVRSILHALIVNPPPGYRVEPVYGCGGNRPYRYARRYTLDMVGAGEHLQLEDAPIEARHGDIFLGLDLFTNGTAQNRDLLQQMRERGTQVYFVIYDVLPMQHPHWFPFGTKEYFGEYLEAITHSSDGVVCISRAVADELTEWKNGRENLRQSPLKMGYFHLGADIDASKPSFGLPDNAETVFAAVAARPSVLMVGTVEPRKGHGQALEAFDRLWEQGVDANLVIVGKEGWMVEKVAKRLRAHPEREQRLFWLAGVSDEMLLKLYQSCSGLLAASEGEGFGLPLIEAAQHGIPILAREIPVFREVCGTHAHYFEADKPAQLATALRQWLELLRAGTAPASAGMPWLNWEQSAQQLLDAVIGQRWYSALAAPEAAPAALQASPILAIEQTEC